jgi:hypothetical protein
MLCRDCQSCLNGWDSRQASHINHCFNDISSISAGPAPAFSMSRMSRHVHFCSQWPYYGCGSSTRHGCNMDDTLTDFDKIDPAVGYELLAKPPDHGQETLEQKRKRVFWRLMFGCQLAWEAGDSLAIARAVRVCRIFHELLPRWLTRATMELVDCRMSPAERREQSALVIHTMRWRAVTGLRDPKRWPYDRGELSQRRKKLLVGAPKLTWEKCWSGAAEILDGTEACGSAATIRASYMLIKHAGGERTTLESYRAARCNGAKQQQLKTRATT